jgi:hypothetical protein
MTNADRSCVLAAMKRAGAPLTREEFLTWFYLGEVPDEIPFEDEVDFLEQFQLSTLLETPMLPDEIH